MNKKIRISGFFICFCSNLMLILPLIVFCLTWLKPIWGITFSFIFVFLFYTYTKHRKNSKYIELKLYDILLGIILISAFAWISGLGGFFYQTFDNHARNAVFRDLINESWPVIYAKTDNALVYYHLFWCIPALVGKVMGWLGANIVLYLQGVFFLIFTVFNILSLLHDKEIKMKMLTVVVIFAVFAGMNILGQSITQVLGWCNSSVGLNTNEGWLDFNRNGYDCSYLYRGNFDSLCQIYNQALPSWLVTSLYLKDRNPKTCAFIGLLLVPYGPIPFVGLLLLIAADQAIYFIQACKNKTVLIKEYISVENILSVCCAFIFLLYFTCNETGTTISWYVPLSEYTYERIISLILFYIFEFGIYAFITYTSNKKNNLWWIANIILLLIPFFKLGYGRDFCMNASLPALFIVMYSLIKEIGIGRKQSLKMNILASCIAIASLSIIFGVSERVLIMKNEHLFPIVADDARSYSERTIDQTDYDPYNYLSPNYSNHLFYKFLAK